MTALIRGALQGEIIPPGKGLTVIVVPGVLSLEALPPIALGAGLSLGEIAELAARGLGGEREHYGFAAEIDGLPIERDLWHRVRPKPGTTVLLRAVAGGEGDNGLMKTLLGAAVAVAGALLTAVNPLLGAAVTIGGQMLVNALFPIAPPVLAAVDSGAITSATYSLSGSSNVLDPYGFVPSILGRHRYTPKLGAKTYTELVGADLYFRMLVIWGYGPIEISDIKIGETPLASFSDYEIETRYGYPGDPAPTLFPSQVFEEVLSAVITAADGTQSRTTDVNVDELSVDVVAPDGTVRVDANGAAQSYNVQVRVEYRATGTADAPTLLGVLTFSGRSRDPIRLGLRGKVARGQYDVLVTKISADYVGTDQVVEQIVWTAIRGIRTQSPLTFNKPVAWSALRIRATSQFNGQIDQLNGIVASKVSAFNGDAWVGDTVSNRPADLFRHVLQGPANARPRADSKIDLDSLEAWWVVCRDKGYEFNMVRDFKGSVDDALVAIAAAGRAAVRRADGRIGVVFDDPAAPVVQFFSPRNSWGFAGERKYQKSPPHGFRVRFVNEDAGSNQDEIIVYDDGYNADGSGGLIPATLFESIEFPGVTKSSLNWRHGRFHIAQERLRPETYTLNADLKGFVPRRGARVRVMSDVALWGLNAGRIVSAAAVGANDQVVLDEPVIMEAGKTYIIRFWLSDSSSGTRQVITDDGETMTLTLVGHGLLPEPDDEWSIGEEDKGDSVVLRVLRWVPGPNLSAKLYLVDDAPEISLADQGVIPPFDSHITIPVDKFTVAPINLGITEAYQGVDGATATGVLFSWETIGGEVVAGFDTQDRDDDGGGMWKDTGSVGATDRVVFIPDLLKGIWSFRVRAVFPDGSVSKWTELARVDVTAGAGLVLPDVTNFVTSYDDDTAGLKWDRVKFSRLEVFYEIRRGADWDTGLTVVPQVADPPVALLGIGDYHIKAKAQPLPGITIYSQNAASLTITGAILVRNVLSKLDERADGWTGTITGPAVRDGEFIRTTAAGEIAYYEIHASRIFANGYVRPIRIEMSIDAVGVSADDNFLTNPDVINTADIYRSALTQQIEVWGEIAEAIEVNPDVYAGQDVFAAPDVYGGSIVFGEWRKFVSGQYLNLFTNLRIALRSNNDSVHAALLDWVIVGDVPDRLDHYTNLAVPAVGVTVTFVPKGGSDPKPFKGGPDGAPGSDPHAQITILDGVAGDKIDITTPISLAGISFRILNGGVPQDRVVNLEVQGY